MKFSATTTTATALIVVLREREERHEVDDNARREDRAPRKDGDRAARLPRQQVDDRGDHQRAEQCGRKVDGLHIRPAACELLLPPSVILAEVGHRPQAAIVK